MVPGCLRMLCNQYNSKDQDSQRREGNETKHVIFFECSFGLHKRLLTHTFEIVTQMQTLNLCHFRRRLGFSFRTRLMFLDAGCLPSCGAVAVADLGNGDAFEHGTNVVTGDRTVRCNVQECIQ